MRAFCLIRLPPAASTASSYTASRMEQFVKKNEHTYIRICDVIQNEKQKSDRKAQKDEPAAVRLFYCFPVCKKRSQTRLRPCSGVRDWNRTNGRLLRRICLLKQAGYKFHLSLIGNGELEDEIREMIKEEDVEDCAFI